MPATMTRDDKLPPLVFGMISPVFERVFQLEHFQPGMVNRAVCTDCVPSGCCVTAARAASSLGADVTLVTTAGGASGSELRRLLARERFETRFVQVQADTRNVVTVVTGHSTAATVIVEPSEPFAEGDVCAFHAALVECSASSTYVLLGGSLPPRTLASSYAALVTALQGSGKTVAVDTTGDALALCVEAGARIIKTNLEQLPCSVDTADDREVVAYLRSLTLHGADIVICSAGEAAARVVWNGCVLTVTPPQVLLRNQFGSGDTAIGALLWALQNARSVEDSLRFFAAAGAANAETLLPGTFDISRVYELFEQVRIEAVAFIT
jgi:1-phosphofructokinase family hexose kinase